MERHTGVGAHERSRGTAGGVWTVEKHFSWQKAPDVPTEAQMADFTSPLAKKGEVICGFKLVPLNTNSPGPAEVIKGAREALPSVVVHGRAARALRATAHPQLRDTALLLRGVVLALLRCWPRTGFTPRVGLALACLRALSGAGPVARRRRHH